MLSNRNQNYSLVMLGLICVAVAYFAIRPSWNNISDSRQALAQADEKKQQLIQANEQLSNFLKQFQSMDEKATIIEQTLPKTPKTPELLASLEQFAKLSGLTLANLNLTESADNNKLPKYSITPIDVDLAANGSYPAFKDFIGRLENHLRLLDIQLMNFEVDDNANATYQIKFKTYYQK